MPPHAVARRRTTGSPSSLADLDVVIASLRPHGAGALAGRASSPCGAPSCCSGSTCAALDLRQNADVHEQVVAELLAVAGVCDGYLELDEASADRVLHAELRRPARCAPRSPPTAS